MGKEINALKEAKAAVQQLRERTTAMVAEHTALLREREAVALAHPPLEEVLANARRLVDEEGARFVGENARSVVRAVGGHVDYIPGTTTERFAVPYLPGFGFTVPGIGIHPLTLQQLAAIAPDIVKSFLERAIRACPGRFGLGEPARSEKLAQIDARLADIEAAHTDLVDAAAAYDVRIPYMPAVEERKYAERRAAASAEAEAADRANGIFRVGGIAAR